MALQQYGVQWLQSLANTADASCLSSQEFAIAVHAASDVCLKVRAHHVRCQLFILLQYDAPELCDEWLALFEAALPEPAHALASVQLLRSLVRARRTVAHSTVHQHRHCRHLTACTPDEGRRCGTRSASSAVGRHPRGVAAGACPGRRLAARSL